MEAYRDFFRTCFEYGLGQRPEGQAEMAQKPKTVVKLLLLGPAGSGKSTVVKQMQIIHLVS